LKLTHPEETLLEEAVKRIEPVTGRDHVFVATTKALEKAIQSEAYVPKENVLAEPEKRNTLGAVCWVGASLLARFPDDQVTVAFITADHKIGNAPLFRDTVEVALIAAEQSSGLVTIGVRPTRAETGYGYIQIRDHDGERKAQRAHRFHEKPDAALAREYLAGGEHLWNSGMFFWTLEGFQKALKEALPKAYETFTQMAEALRAGDAAKAEKLFLELPNASVDHALMEKASDVFVVPAEFPWDDVGSWDALERTFERSPEGNIVQGEVILLDSKGCVVVNDAKLNIGVIGVSDLVIVASEHGILVCHKDRAQDVKKVASQIENKKT
jgi:mannose-1-phosphate guanylyltransferase